MGAVAEGADEAGGVRVDVEDAFEWLRDREGRLKVDASKIAVLGGSAGGYLTLATGYRVKPRPACLVPFWGYGDFVGDWYSKPSPHKSHNRVLYTEDHARKQVSGPPVSDSRLRKGNGGVFYNWCRQKGRWPLEVSGWDPRTQAKKFNPYMPVKNVTGKYPPTLLIHGNGDETVAPEQSELMYRALLAAGVPSELHMYADQPHAFDAEPVFARQCADLMRLFLDRYVSAPVTAG